MILRIYTIRQKLNAEWSIIIKNSLNSSKGGAFSILIVGLAIIIAALLVLTNSVDFAIYSSRRNTIGKAVDYAVSAAIQEIDADRSGRGLSESFNMSGALSLDFIYLHEQRADNAFFTTFYANTGITRNNLEGDIVIAIISPVSTGLEYTIKTKAARYTGITDSPAKMEQILNSRINEFWNTTDPEADKHLIYVNGNPKTTEFKKRPYYLVFIKDFRIDGLFRKRTATFVGFKGTKIER